MVTSLVDNFYGFDDERRDGAVHSLRDVCSNIDLDTAKFDDLPLRVVVALYDEFNEYQQSVISPVISKYATHPKSPIFLKSFYEGLPENSSCESKSSACA
jgi:hypothetical protein